MAFSGGRRDVVMLFHLNIFPTDCLPYSLRQCPHWVINDSLYNAPFATFCVSFSIPGGLMVKAHYHKYYSHSFYRIWLAFGIWSPDSQSSSEPLRLQPNCQGLMSSKTLSGMSKFDCWRRLTRNGYHVLCVIFLISYLTAP